MFTFSHGGFLALVSPHNLDLQVALLRFPAMRPSDLGSFTLRSSKVAIKLQRCFSIEIFSDVFSSVPKSLWILNGHGRSYASFGQPCHILQHLLMELRQRSPMPTAPRSRGHGPRGPACQNPACLGIAQKHVHKCVFKIMVYQNCPYNVYMYKHAYDSTVQIYIDM